jgi:hypothetical protein
MMTGLVANPVSAAKAPNETTVTTISEAENDSGSFAISGEGSNKAGTANSAIDGNFQLSKASIKKDKPASATFNEKATLSTTDPRTADFGPTKFSGTNISGSLEGTVSPAGPKANFNVVITIKCHYNGGDWGWEVKIRWLSTN